ncbi:MAG: FkbM family methyltransferase [Candidatus Omnitrophota bacterium]
MRKYQLLICKLIDRIFYRHFFFAYKALYFNYKNISERKRLNRLKNIVKPGMNVLDIGANIGFYSIFLAKLVGEKGRVHAFEPDELNFCNLEKNTKKYRNVVINRLAVGEKSEEILLYHSDVLNVDCQTFDSGENRRTTKVKCVAIDDYFKAAEKVDLVKIDIQGYDYFALKGMARTLERSKNIVILGEFSPYGLKKTGIDPAAYLKLLEELGFAVEIANGSNREELLKKSGDELFYTDFFAFKRKAPK